MVDRAEMSRLGEGLNEHGSIQPEPMQRTANAVKDMVEEAKREGALAISAVGTAVFRHRTEWRECRRRDQAGEWRRG